MNLTGEDTQVWSREAEAEFEKIFKSNYKNLYSYAQTIVHDSIMAEEMVQNVFCRLWEKREQIQVRESTGAYLYRSVYHESLNYLKHLKVRDTYQAYVLNQMANSDSAAYEIELSELEDRLESALLELPEKCRTIFQMSRFEELKYQEIADKLEIPVKTVENQMGKALKLLRLKLVDFLPAVLIVLLLNY
jgi:RNA polymerase sigma-70 factor (ECF subfamily)